VKKGPEKVGLMMMMMMMMTSAKWKSMEITTNIITILWLELKVNCNYYYYIN